jgi:hypothetical protein
VYLICLTVSTTDAEAHSGQLTVVEQPARYKCRFSFDDEGSEREFGNWDQLTTRPKAG